jgi:hypothetical protein
LPWSPYAYLTLPDVRDLATTNPTTTAFMKLRESQAASEGPQAPAPPSVGSLQPHLQEPAARRHRRRRRALLRARGLDLEELRKSIEINMEKGAADSRRQHDHAAAREEPVSVAIEGIRFESCAS